MRYGMVLPVVTAGLLAVAAVARAAGPDPAQGERLYKRYCAGCHGTDGRGGAHTFMPHVENLTKQGYVDLLTDDYLATAIKDGGVAVGKSAYMPAWGDTLSDGEIASVIAHIRQLPLY